MEDIIVYTYENNHYFISSQIVKLLGYKDTNRIIRDNVDNENKLTFKNFPGTKEPVIDARSVLITRNGICDLLSKIKKPLTKDSIEILNKLNIYTSNNKSLEEDEEDEDSVDDIDPNNLITYSYISNGIFNEYFIGYQIIAKLGYKNITQALENVSKCNKLIFSNYPGPKHPKLDPKTILITRDGAIELLIKTRKRITPDVLELFKEFGISITNKKCLTKEQQCLLSITNTFKTEKFEDQYKVDCYYIDLYFPEYKILVEVDENGHKDRKPGDERERMDIVNEVLEINDNHWIRFNPDEHDFDITKVIGRIYRKINEIKGKKIEEELREKENKIEEELREKYKLLEKSNEQPVKKEEPEWKLQIEPITCKFTAPPKECLLNMLKTKNISDIAKSYGISTNPVAKWLKQYEINIKDFHNYDAPQKEELIEQCKEKTQTEVALHYNVSNHIIRKWLKSYDLDFLSIKKEVKEVTKDELIKLTCEFSLEEVAKKLNITILNLEKLMKTHSIEKIPTKDELEKNLHLKSKDELAKLYNTCRTTLRKWIRSYGLEHIRYKITTNIEIYSITEDNIKTKYSSIKELCETLHISKRKMYEIINKDIYYNGYKFEHVKQGDEPEEDTDNLEEDILVQDKDIIKETKEIDIRLTCGCGSEIYKKYQKKHEKTKKHQDYILSIEIL